MSTWRGIEVRGLYNIGRSEVQIHRKGCAMLSTGKAGSGRVKLLDPDDIEDAAERGFKIITCRCVQQTGAEK